MSRLKAVVILSACITLVACGSPQIKTTVIDEVVEVDTVDKINEYTARKGLNTCTAFNISLHPVITQSELLQGDLGKDLPSSSQLTSYLSEAIGNIDMSCGPYQPLNNGYNLASAEGESQKVLKESTLNLIHNINTLFTLRPKVSVTTGNSRSVSLRALGANFSNDKYTQNIDIALDMDVKKTGRTLSKTFRYSFARSCGNTGGVRLHETDGSALPVGVSVEVCQGDDTSSAARIAFQKLVNDLVLKILIDSYPEDAGYLRTLISYKRQ